MTREERDMTVYVANMEAINAFFYFNRIDPADVRDSVKFIAGFGFLAAVIIDIPKCGVRTLSEFEEREIKEGRGPLSEKERRVVKWALSALK
ncbi:hypothetical protein [Escherichia coli]|uniref:hypothetical protein n=1 Tax=Escherichia coli TaxID=562 RepID=UPI001ADAD801|nr:hypothetical protein [Escherichia coli]MBO9236533.1 hypothetical protein [Escherichia coli]